MRHSLILSASLLGLLLACGGRSSPGDSQSQAARTAKTLTYTNPSTGDYRLLKNEGLSSSTHLVLDLVGPDGVRARGVALCLRTDPSLAAWSRMRADASHIAESPAFIVATSLSDLWARTGGGTLQMGAFQKGSSLPPVTFTPTTVLARVSLDLVPDQRPGAVALSTGSCILVPEAHSEALRAITIALGSLRAE